MRFEIRLAGFLGVVAICASAAQTPRESLLVLAKAGRTLSIVDPATLHVVAQMPSGPDPHEVIASSDGTTAYISNYGGGRYNTITVVDLVRQKTVQKIDLGPLHGPHGLTFVGGKLWFTAEANKVIGRYDPATRAVDWIMGTGQNRTHMLYVFPNLQRIITSNVASGTLTIFEAKPSPLPMGDWNATVIPVGHGSEGFDVSPDQREVWVANAGEGTISVIDLAEKKVVQTIQANVRSANRLKFTLDGKLVFVSPLNGSLAIFDAASRREVKRVKLGRGSAGILMEPSGKRAFVACSPDDYVAVMDLKTLTVAGYIDAGKNPDGMAWAERKP